MEYSDKPPFEGHIRYCVRCCMPETERGTSLDELGICRACRSSEEKMHIDWDERELALRALLDEATERAKGNYDCMIPISGGKDSTFQLYVLTQLYGVKPLAVTFNQNWQSESGWYNLMNCLEQFDVDLLMFTPSRKLVNRVAKRSIEMIGDGCWHCHAGLSAFPLHIAIKYDVPLIIKGEPPSEQGLSSYCKPLKVDYSFHFKTSTLKQAHEMECDYLSSKDLFPLVFPSEGEYVEAGVTHIKLGSYIFWDDERQTEFVRDNFAWRETEMEPSYKRYKCVECVMPGIHDFTCYLKRGFGRATFQACADVRNGLMTRSEGFRMVNKYDCRRPEALDYFLENTAMSEEEFNELMAGHRAKVFDYDEEMPVHRRTRANEELLVPYPEQVISRWREAHGMTEACPAPEHDTLTAPLGITGHFEPDAGAVEELRSLGLLKDAEGLEAVLREARLAAGDDYDCVLPVTGTLQNYFLFHVVCRVYGLKPLAVVVNHRWHTEAGWYDLQNLLETFDVDRMEYLPNKSLVERATSRSMSETGSPCWFWEAAYLEFARRVAVNHNIPLVIVSEPGPDRLALPAESDAPVAADPSAMVAALAGRTPAQMIGGELDFADLYMINPDVAQDGAPVRHFHLGWCVDLASAAITELVLGRYCPAQAAPGAPKGPDRGAVVPGMQEFDSHLEEGSDAARFVARVTGQGGGEDVTTFLEDAVRRLTPESQDGSERFMAEWMVEGEGPSALPASFHDLSVADIQRAYKSGALDPVDVAGLCRSVVEAREADLQAWVVFDGDELMEQARAAREAMADDERCRLLRAVPVGVKDVFNSREYPTQMGSPLWEDFRPGNDARVVHDLKQAGAIVPGKTVTAEFAVHALGKTLNPFDPARTPGTSSSGSAVAVATGMVPAAMGTQTAGSIIRPASFCGVFGCKPSFGLIPRTGVLKTTDSLDSIGFFTKHLEDLPLVFESVRVKGPNYPFSHAALSDPLRQGAPQGRPWRVLVAKTHTWEHVPDYARQAFLDWADKLAAVPGVEVVDESLLPAGMERSHEIHRRIYNKTLSYYFAQEYNQKMFVSEVMNQLIEDGFTITPDMYMQALVDQKSLYDALDESFSDFDMVVTLSTSGHAPLREVVESPDSALMWTLCHVPAVSVPVFTSPRGLPFGLQVVSRKYDDFKLFRFLNFMNAHGLVPSKGAEV